MTAALLACAYAVAALLLFRDAWASPATRWIGTPGDPVFSIWMIHWAGFAASHGLNPLFTDRMNAPAGLNMMWQTYFLPAVPLAALTRAAGAVFTYNLVVTAGLAVSCWCAYLAVTRHVASTAAAAAAGLLYGFGPAITAETLQHAPFISAAFVPPLLFMALEDLLVHQRRRWWMQGGLLGLLLVLQASMSEEMLALEFFATVVAIALLARWHADHLRRRWRYVVGASAAAVGLFAALAGPVLAYQFLGPLRPIGRLHGGTAGAVDLFGLLVPTARQLLNPGVAAAVSARYAGDASEWTGYVGLPLLALAVWCRVRFGRLLVVRLSAAMVVALVLAALGATLHVGGREVVPMPWLPMYFVPLFEDVINARFMVLADFFLVLLLAIFVDRLVMVRQPWRPWAGALAVLSLVTLLPAHFPASGAATPPFFAGGAGALRPGSNALLVPLVYSRENTPMLWQVRADMRFRMPEGYYLAPTATGEARTGPESNVLTRTLADMEEGRAGAAGSGQDAAMMAILRRWKVDTVVVGPGPGHAAYQPFFTRLLGAQPAQTGGVLVWDSLH